MWKFEKNSYEPKTQILDESLFMVGNGYIGVRGCFEEGYPEGDSIRGTYINGLYDRVPMVHAEMAYGFPTVQDKQPRLLDTQTCAVYLDGEPAGLVEGRYQAYLRTLDYLKGETRRSYIFITKSGRKAQLCFKRLASFVEKNILVYRIEVQYEGVIELVSICDTNIENYSNPNDPRTGQSHTQLMKLMALSHEGEDVHVMMQTQNTSIKQATTVRHHVKTGLNSEMVHITKAGAIETHIQGKDHLVLDKICLFTDGLRNENIDMDIQPLLNKLKDSYDYDYFSNLQSQYLDEFWLKTGIEIEGASSDQSAIRYMQYQLLQSVGTDLNANISAKGLSGEGYEGHYFWDTEIYVLPVMLFNQPERAKTLLEYRYHILPQARLRAHELGHHKGAAYAWRTISGIECSGYFPAGTAQYHINSDIAYAFIQYYLYTGDLAFMASKGAEVIFETARIWLEIGHFHQGTFQIHNVTGPDEYTAIVNNNYYTNAMAKYHLMWANRFYNMLKNTTDIELLKQAEMLFEKIGITDDEAETMLKASDQMYFKFDENLRLYAQDDSFLSKPRWPFETADPSKKPLLLHYHPLTIYRHQVLKQADTVLAHFLLEQYAEPEFIKNAFDFYEELTTHDSSLSSCIYGIVASKCGLNQKAYAYFKESIVLDLEDTHHNTKDGLHMANMAGSILGVVAGFAGLRVTENGISIKSNLPKSWQKLKFKIEFRGRIIEIEIHHDGVDCKLIKGNPINIKVNDKWHLLKLDHDSYRGIVFDLDGVLTETSHAHYLAWKALAEGLNFSVPDALEDQVRGISRRAALDMVLAYSENALKYTEAEKEALATRKNEIYLEKIAHYTDRDLCDGARTLLDFLKNNGFKIALASASRNAPFLIKAMGIESYFDAVVNPQDIKKGKPAPDIFLKACELIDLNPSECIGVEDAYAGIESIKTAGLLPIGIGHMDTLYNSDIVMNDLNLLLSLLE
ncbi:beta-phosphoglucomutase [Fusibacter ferrireducens]|uniref:Beta-phosphoglucomutase n=1 Tax=Fusibacter ferrireducens TaxID=2785058 RepID=A0ABR9ZUN9_9FIRM|nr:beta-phosphoglucomutase [Fusibacter ferrireducens]MBF4694160.1 beta-phosphoglucomutase [Fusibacter ferrireducens]